MAAPVFQQVMQQTLAYLRVSPDVPLTAPVERAGKRQREEMAKDEDLSDFDPAQVADGSEAISPPVESPTVATPTHSSSHTEEGLGSAPTVVVEQGEGVEVPRFAGMTVRGFIEECVRLGFNPVPVGTGIAVDQLPEPGAKVRSGSRIVVRFAPRAAVQTVARKGR